MHAMHSCPRRQEGGSDLGARFLLMEIRADWPALSSTVGIPHWNARAGMCWKRSASMANYQDLSAGAAWRHQRFTHEAFARHHPRAMRSPLWTVPGMQTSVLRHDWLHVMDEGVSKEFAAGVLSLILQHRRGGREVNMRVVSNHVKAWYETPAASQVLSRYDRLVTSVLQGGSHVPGGEGQTCMWHDESLQGGCQGGGGR